MLGDAITGAMPVVQVGEMYRLNVEASQAGRRASAAAAMSARQIAAVITQRARPCRRTLEGGPDLSAAGVTDPTPMSQNPRRCCDVTSGPALRATYDGVTQHAWRNALRRRDNLASAIE
jgi:hypothetical protein